MWARDLKDCEEIVAGDGCSLREIIHARKGDFKINYSLAYAQIGAGNATKPHKLAYSEVYYVIKGRGLMYIDNEERELSEGSTVYIPPFSIQYIKNLSEDELCFLCIVDPAWEKSCERILRKT
ncbi:MAG: cupin domain-containing protein [Candidatus Omnitrophota bacterium]